MLKKRIIACLDVANGKVVKGIKFQGHRVVGDMFELAKAYSDYGIDELVFYDILASPEKRAVDPLLVEKIAKLIDIPFSVAGGIKSIHDARSILCAGAEKISVNSMAIKNPELISNLANEFGGQAVVVGVDSKLVDNEYVVFQYTGSDKTILQSTLKTKIWLEEIQKLGAGEIVLNTMDGDGTKNGFQIEQIRIVTEEISIPIVASGGAGCALDFVDVFKNTKVTGALAASIFHEGTVSITEVRDCLKENNIQVRSL